MRFYVWIAASPLDNIFLIYVLCIVSQQLYSSYYIQCVFVSWSTPTLLDCTFMFYPFSVFLYLSKHPPIYVVWIKTLFLFTYVFTRFFSLPIILSIELMILRDFACSWFYLKSWLALDVLHELCLFRQSYTREYVNKCILCEVSSVIQICFGHCDHSNSYIWINDYILYHSLFVSLIC